MKRGLHLAGYTAGAAILGALIFAGDRLAFEAQALLLRPADHVFDGSTLAPEVVIQCVKPDCEAGSIYYEVIVDEAGRPRAIRPDGEVGTEPSDRARAAKAALATRWPKPSSSRPFRAFQPVMIVPAERPPSHHVLFPDTGEQTVSITLERAGMYNRYGIYSVTLNSDGYVDFCGEGFVKNPGRHHARISSTAFDRLVDQFRDARFFSFDDRYVATDADGEDHYLRVRIGDQEKTVVDAGGRRVGMPVAIAQLQREVDEAAETSKWVGSVQEWRSKPIDMTCPSPIKATLFSRTTPGSPGPR